jgi:glutamate-1-semialdehyde 2,1-aminomutase
VHVSEALRAKSCLSLRHHERSARVLASEVVQTVHMPHALYIDRAKGSRIVDVDGNEYIDLTMGYGTHVLGHAPDSVVAAVRRQAGCGLHYGLHNAHQTRLAELITEAVPSVEEVVFTNSGTEATLYAVRAARALTGRTGIGLFDGSYHGVHDVVLAGVDRESPREAPRAVPKGAGIPPEVLGGVRMLPYRSASAFAAIRRHRSELAAVLVEPVQSSNPRLDVAPWLMELRRVCSECGVLLVLDEVITGFRLAFGGAQERFGVEADLVTYGKALGGGTPIGAVGGRRDVMSVFGPGARGARGPAGSGAPVRIFAGTTFAGNPLSMVAGVAAVEEMRDRKDEIYPHLEAQTERMAREVNAFLASEGIDAQVRHAGSMFHLPFQSGPIESARDVRGDRAELENRFYLHLLSHGVLVPGIHLAFLSAAHTVDDVDRVVAAYVRSFLDLRKAGEL